MEVGCSAGVNIYVISQAFPGVKLYGIDINKRAIEEGKKQFERMGMSNVFLYTGKADKLKRFDDKSKDVVFTDAILMYIGPEKI